MEKRIKKLEAIVARLVRRERKKVTVVIPPYPISNAVFGDRIDGTILTYMFPCDGVISKGVIDFGSRPKRESTVSISIMGIESGRSESYKINTKSSIMEHDIIVSEFDRLTISISYTSDKPEDDLKEVWISMLWVADIKDSKVKQLAYEEIENDINSARD